MREREQQDNKGVRIRGLRSGKKRELQGYYADHVHASRNNNAELRSSSSSSLYFPGRSTRPPELGNLWNGLRRSRTRASVQKRVGRSPLFVPMSSRRNLYLCILLASLHHVAHSRAPPLDAANKILMPVNRGSRSRVNTVRYDDFSTVINAYLPHAHV